ncbi:hypothetical protein D3C85_1882610 [compost metagenome]
MQDNEPHAAQDVALDAFHHLVADLGVGHVPPPEEDVGGGQGFLREPVLRVGQRCRGDA